MLLLVGLNGNLDAVDCWAHPFGELKETSRRASEEPLSKRMVHARLCISTSLIAEEGMLDKIEREIVLMGSLTEEQRGRLLEIANKCPVHRTLTSEIKIESWLA